MKTLVIATRNLGKVKEVKALLRCLPYSIISLSDLPSFPDVPETGTTFEANAIIKATTIGHRFGHLTLADDSGLVVDALDGRPGVYSARYGQNDADRIQKLLTELKSVPLSKRSARFVCALALYHPQTHKTQTVIGAVEGIIAALPTGSNGFGYDPIFYSPQLKKTFAQATMAEKNTISHRAHALNQAHDLLKEIAKTTPVS